MSKLFKAVLALVLCSGVAHSQTLSPDAINGAVLKQDTRQLPNSTAPDPAILKAEVLLDRAGFSPGAIDGQIGENLKKALRAFAEVYKLKSQEALDDAVWAKLNEISPDPVVTTYVITAEDLKGPFTPTIPPHLEEMADLPHLGYRNARELLAEKFHMSEKALAALNEEKDLNAEGTEIVVANVRPMSMSSSRQEKRTAEADLRAARLVIAKGELTLRAYGDDGRLLAFFPVTIGSEESPPPSGTVAVERVARNPTYNYDPKRVTNGKADHKLVIRSGPNNPVGLVWIALDVPTYGIHGTPEPERISKSHSSGCVRLTNWDALKLAGMVEKGIPVEFNE